MSTVQITITLDSANKPSRNSSEPSEVTTGQTIEFVCSSTLLTYLQNNPTKTVYINIGCSLPNVTFPEQDLSAMISTRSINAPSQACDLNYSCSWSSQEGSELFSNASTSSGTIIVRPPEEEI